MCCVHATTCCVLASSVQVMSLGYLQQRSEVIPLASSLGAQLVLPGEGAEGRGGQGGAGHVGWDEGPGAGQVVQPGDASRTPSDPRLSRVLCSFRHRSAQTGRTRRSRCSVESCRWCLSKCPPPLLPSIAPFPCSLPNPPADETVYDAVLLLDRVMSVPLKVADGLLGVALAACLLVAAEQSGLPEAPPPPLVRRRPRLWEACCS